MQSFADRGGWLGLVTACTASPLPRTDVRDGLLFDCVRVGRVLVKLRYHLRFSFPLIVLDFYQYRWIIISNKVWQGIACACELTASHLATAPYLSDEDV